MSKLNVAVIFGGGSVGCGSAINSAINVIDNLSREKYNVIPVYVNDLGNWFLYEGKPNSINSAEWENFGTRCQVNLDRHEQGLLRISGERIRNIPVDIAIPLLRGTLSSGAIQGVLEMGGIKYVGASIAASAMAADRGLNKALAKALGLACPKYLVFDSKELDGFDAMLRVIRYKVGYPCYVKPLKKGILNSTRATNKRELEEAMLRAFLHSSKIIVEKEVVGRELVCTTFVLFNAPEFCEEGAIFRELSEVMPDGGLFPYPHLAPSHKIDKKTVAKIKESSAAFYKTMNISCPVHFKFFFDEQTKSVVFSDISTELRFDDDALLKKFMLVQEVLDKLIDDALR